MKTQEGSADASSARVGRENLYWREIGKEVETSIYGSGLAAGMVVRRAGYHPVRGDDRAHSSRPARSNRWLRKYPHNAE